MTGKDAARRIFDIFMNMNFKKLSNGTLILLPNNDKITFV